ncbi:hypothetical protein ACJENL_26810, partial [Escherichia coli]
LLPDRRFNAPLLMCRHGQVPGGRYRAPQCGPAGVDLALQFTGPATATATLSTGSTIALQRFPF